MQGPCFVPILGESALTVLGKRNRDGDVAVNNPGVDRVAPPVIGPITSGAADQGGIDAQAVDDA